MSEDKKELLKEIFDNINYWLAFAEAKNAGLLAFNIAALALLFSMEKINVVGYILAVIILSSTFFVFLALWSRFAAMWENKEEPEEKDNLLYYRDIAKYSEENFLLKFHKNYFNESLTNTASVDPYIRNIASEIWTNAKITSRKFDLFNIALKVDIVALIVAVVAVIIIA